jgi:hypothetical protein
MTAFSVGRDVAAPSGFGMQASGGNAVAKALGIITALIPAEAIAAFLATISAVAALSTQSDLVPILNVWLAIPLGIFATFVFAFVGAADGIIALPAAERWKKILWVVVYSIGISLLFIVYVGAMPENPIEVMWGIQSAWGGLVAVVFTILWGGIKALIDAYRPTPP